MFLCLKRKTPFCLLRFKWKGKTLCSNLPFYIRWMGTWNSISGWFQSGNGVSGGNKKSYVSFNCWKEVVTSICLPFERSNQIKWKSLCATCGEKKCFWAGVRTRVTKVYGAMRACLKKMLSTTNRKQKSNWVVHLVEILVAARNWSGVGRIVSGLGSITSLSISSLRTLLLCSLLSSGPLVDVVLLDGGRCSDRSDGGCRGCWTPSVGHVVAVVVAMLCSWEFSFLSLGGEVGSIDISSSLLLLSGSDAFSSDAMLLSLLAFAPNPGSWPNSERDRARSMFEAIFDQERSGKNLSQSTRGSLISGTKSSNELPWNLVWVCVEMMSQSTRGFSISEVKARKNWTARDWSLVNKWK